MIGQGFTRQSASTCLQLLRPHSPYTPALSNDFGIAYFILGDLERAAALFHLAIWPDIEGTTGTGTPATRVIYDAFDRIPIGATAASASATAGDIPPLPLSPITSMKNLAWMMQLLNRPAPALLLYKGVETVVRAHAYNGDGGEGRLEEADGEGLLLYDFPVGERICSSPSLARNVVKRKGGDVSVRGSEAVFMAEAEAEAGGGGG